MPVDQRVLGRILAQRRRPSVRTVSGPTGGADRHVEQDVLGVRRHIHAGRWMTALDAPELTAEAVARAAVQIACPLGKDPNTEPIIDWARGEGGLLETLPPSDSIRSMRAIRPGRSDDRVIERAYRFSAAHVRWRRPLPAVAVDPPVRVATFDDVRRVDNSPWTHPGRPAAGSRRIR